jgi:tRNA(fMet)-specific endonuclease VapC
MSPSLLDTDILSALMKGRNPHVQVHAVAYLQRYGRLSFSLITRYEILRGLQAVKAARQVAAFHSLSQRSEVLELTDGIVSRAADVYALLYQRGQLIGDADILIASTALEHQRTLVTVNLSHFQRIPGLALENWTQP